MRSRRHRERLVRRHSRKNFERLFSPFRPNGTKEDAVVVVRQWGAEQSSKEHAKLARKRTADCLVRALRISASETLHSVSPEVAHGQLQRHFTVRWSQQVPVPRARIPQLLICQLARGAAYASASMASRMYLSSCEAGTLADHLELPVTYMMQRRPGGIASSAPPTESRSA